MLSCPEELLRSFIGTLFGSLSGHVFWPLQRRGNGPMACSPLTRSCQKGLKGTDLTLCGSTWPAAWSTGFF